MGGRNWALALSGGIIVGVFAATATAQAPPYTSPRSTSRARASQPLAASTTPVR
jgi:hypothetical protein